MGVYTNLQIAPKGNKIIQLEAIQSFVSSLIAGGHIESEWTIWTGETDTIKELNRFFFKDWSVLSEVSPGYELYPSKESDLVNSSEPKSYVFKIHLSKKSELFQNLDVFAEPDFQHFPIYVLFFHQPIDYTIIREFWTEENGDINEKVLIHTNCIILSDGRNGVSPYGLHREKDYVGFYNYVRKLMGEFEIGIYFN